MQYIGAQNYEVMNRVLNYYGILSPNSSIGCEIGVRHGLFSEYLLINNPNLSMVCVDPYDAYQDHIEFYTQSQQEAYKLNAARRFEKFEGRVITEFLTSHDAAPLYKGGFFDFVYIDALHELDAVRQDMEDWIIKIKSKGVLCGHDYSMRSVGPSVREVANKYGKELFHSTPAEGDSWWFQI